jgi:hypothetical protein
MAHDAKLMRKERPSVFARAASARREGWDMRIGLSNAHLTSSLAATGGRDATQTRRSAFRALGAVAFCSP